MRITPALSLLLFGIMLSMNPLRAQQGAAINSTGAPPHPSAMLDVQSTSGGLLIPRISESERNAITAPAEGLQVYNTTSRCIEFYASGAWHPAGCACASAPQTPVIGTATATANSISANWNPAWGASVYLLDVSTAGDFSSFLPGYNGLNVGNVISYNVTGLNPGTTYYYRVRARNACGTTAPSNTGSVTTFFVTGMSYQGGIISFVDNTGLHGRIVTPSDQNTGVGWGGQGINITNGNGAVSFTDGLTNTNSIAAQLGSGTYAARICFDLVSGGYSDWFLPSNDELEDVYQNLHVSSIGSFASAVYWNSTEIGPTDAYAIGFQDGTSAYGTNKNFTFRVRCMRQF